jgi:iron(III) transport system ATP-binding protein
LALSHEIAVMSEGRIVQIGSPRDIYERPRNRFVADFVGSTNFIDGKMLSAAAGNGRCRVATALGELNVQCVETLPQDAPVVVSVRPEDVELFEAPPPREDGDNLCTGTVAAKVFLGDFLDFQVKIGESTLLARVHPSLRTPVGHPINMRMRAEKCVALADTVAPRAAA